MFVKTHPPSRKSALDNITRRLRVKLSDRRADLALAPAVCAIQIVGTLVFQAYQPEQRAVDTAAIVLLVATSAALVLRRKYPGWVLVFVKFATLIYLLLDYPKGPNFLAIILAFFSAVLQGRRLIAWLVLAGEFVLFPWLPYVLGSEPAPTSTRLLGLAGWLLVLAAAAEIAHHRQQRIIRSQDEAAQRRASEERLRIAQELHDVLGHNISLISVQAGVALHLMDKQPEHARTALAVIHGASKESLKELRSVLEVLRQADEEPARAPSAGLASLDELVARASDAGMRVHTEVRGALTELPVAVDLAAFRIIQEALTNVLRHSGQTTARICICRSAHELTVQIDNPSKGGVSTGGDGSGQGILGMRERAAALGGLVETGPCPGIGFRVLARLPIDSGVTADSGESR